MKTTETEWKAEVLEAIAEQAAEEPTAEQQAEEQQTADNQTTEQAEDTAEQQQQLKPRKPKKYHELIDMIINADTESEVSEICYEIDFAYQHDKIKPRENDQLYALINKIF